MSPFCFVEDLPIELQLKIIDCLDSGSILHLQQTCKHLSYLVSEYGDSIWKNCLHRICVQNKLFSPSFKDLSSASDYKEACTKALDLRNRYEQALLDGRSLNSRTVKLKFPLNIWDSTKFFEDIHLVAGGRYLVTAEYTGLLCLWDLEDAGKSGNRPALLTEHQLDTFSYMSCVVPVAGKSSLHILTIADLDVPEDYMQSRRLSGLTGRVYLTGYTVTEVSYHESSNSFEMQEIASLSIISEDSLDPYMDEVDRIILQCPSHKTIAWDFVNHRFTGWTNSLPTFSTQLFSTKDATILLNKDGIHCFECPPFIPLPDDNFIDITTSDFVALNPTYTLPHARHPEDPRESGSFVTADCRPALEAGRPNYYEFIISRGDGDGAYIADRYAFTFKGALASSGSTLTRFETITCSTGPGDSARKGKIFRTCEDRLWTLLENDSSINIACSRPLQSSTALIVKENDGHEKVDYLQTVQLVEQLPVQILADRERLRLSNVGCEFDPTSCKVAALSDRTGDNDVLIVKLL